MTSMDMGSSWCTHGACMVTEIKEYDVRAHEHGMIALCHKLHSAYISTTSGPIFTN